MILAPIVRAAAFTVIDPMTAIWCEKIAGNDGLRLAVLVLTVVALGLIVSLGLRTWRQWGYVDEDYVHGGPVKPASRWR